MIISNRPEGSNITILDTLYLYPKKDINTGKYDKGSMTVIYKDLDTGEKYHETIYDPDYEFYKAKEGENLTYNHLYIEKDKLNKYVVPFRNLEKTIAELTNNTEFYYDNIKNGNRYNNKQLNTHVSLFNSDTDINDHYRYRFGKEYRNSSDGFNLTRAYFDIEADTINMKGNFPELGECPVNAITIINDVNNKIYTFLLRNKNNPLVEEFENSIGPELFNELKTTVRDAIGGWKQEIRYGLDKFEYEMMFYDEENEIDLITDLFKVINITKPDFVLAWNMSFDIPYLIERIKILGYNPEDIICHPDFEEKVCKYKIDTRAQDFTERGDYAAISSYSVYADQMIHFASRRKGNKQFKIVNLDYVGNKIVKVRKLDYSEYTNSIAQLPYVNYKVFVFYNIIDTIVQKCIEKKVNDLDYVFTKCLMNNTRYHKCHRQTIYITNGTLSAFEEDGYILGNNVNKFKEKPKTKYPGAHVAHPLKLNDTSKKKIGGIPVMLFDNLDDFDYKAQYPNSLCQFNITEPTMIGKIKIENKVWEYENPFNYKYYDRGGAFLEDIHSKDYLTVGHRWFNLASFKELVKDVEFYFTHIRKLKEQTMYVGNNGLKNPFIKVNNNDQYVSMYECGDTLKKSFIRVTEMPEYTNFVNNINIDNYVYGGLISDIEKDDIEDDDIEESEE